MGVSLRPNYFIFIGYLIAERGGEPLPVVKQRQGFSTQRQSELKETMLSHGEASHSQVWYLIVSIPDICLLYFDTSIWPYNIA